MPLNCESEAASCNSDARDWSEPLRCRDAFPHCCCCALLLLAGAPALGSAFGLPVQSGDGPRLSTMENGVGLRLPATGKGVGLRRLQGPGVSPLYGAPGLATPSPSSFSSGTSNRARLMGTLMAGW